MANSLAEYGVPDEAVDSDGHTQEWFDGAGGRVPERVEDGPEFQRILALPRRPPPGADNAYDELRKDLTRYLQRHPNPYPVGVEYGGDGYLRAIQAAALKESWTYGGGFCPIRAGGGKQLTCYLLPTIFQSQRPIYVGPAALEKDVLREHTRFYEHWKGLPPSAFPFLSYQTLSSKKSGARINAKGEVTRLSILERLKPDLIVFDEAHSIKNLDAVCTKRVKRYLKANPKCRVVALSGTMTRLSIKDFAHTAAWCLGRNCPVPTTQAELAAWCGALDEKAMAGRRTAPGALLRLGPMPEVTNIFDDDEELDAIRVLVGNRIVETPGVIASRDGPLSIPLKFRMVGPVEEDPKVSELFADVRRLGKMPNGRPIADGLELARHANTMGLDHWMHWDPPPPEGWLLARSDWATAVREKVQNNRRGLESESQIEDAVREGFYPELQGLLAGWRYWAPLYDPEEHKKIMWVSNETTRAADTWLKKNSGIIWVGFIALGDRLEKELGIPYYGAQGMDKKGRFILDHPQGTPMIASAAANRTGRNLQRGWSSNLLFVKPDEQLIARTHRPGQPADEVTFDLYVGCWEHRNSFDKACREANHAEKIFAGQAMRLCYAQLEVPDIWAIESRPGARWTKSYLPAPSALK